MNLSDHDRKLAEECGAYTFFAYTKPELSRLEFTQEQLACLLNKIRHGEGIKYEWQCIEVLSALRNVVIEQNRLGADWHPEVFSKMMAALSWADKVLSIIPSKPQKE